MSKYLLLLVLLIAPFNNYAKDNPQAMIVFDASGSMWGQISGTPKIVIAKEVLSNVVAEWDENIHLGLIAYGHRKKGDCNDIETLIPVGPVDKEAIISTVKNINPKGKTPISRAIKMAAEELRYTEEKATVILISDGKETCDADPCLTAKSLEESGIDFVAHVVGFDVDKQTDAQLRCIADSTGGKYFSANNATSLNDAMAEIVKKVQKKEEPPVVKLKQPEYSLVITAMEVEEGALVDASYSIFTDSGDEDVRGDHVINCSSTKDKACEESIPAGKYIIESHYNKFNLKTPIEIKVGETTTINIIMGGTGKVEITASEVEGGSKLKANYAIFTDSGDEDVRGDHVINCSSTKDKVCNEKIPVGKYIIESRYNKFNLKTPFEIKVGETTTVHIIMGGTGKVEITASEVEGGPKLKANYSIFTDSGDEEMRGDHVTNCSSTKDKACKESIPVGKYIIESHYNKFNLKTPFEIKLGETTEVNLIMGETGKVEITASEVDGGPKLKANYSIFTNSGDEDVRGDHVTNCSSRKDKACKVRIPLGRYVIESHYDGKNHKTPFELKSGVTSKININFETIQPPAKSDAETDDSGDAALLNELEMFTDKQGE